MNHQVVLATIQKKNLFTVPFTFETFFLLKRYVNNHTVAHKVTLLNVLFFYVILMDLPKLLCAKRRTYD